MTTLPSTLISRNVAKQVKSIETPEGDGALVRRSIGTPALRNLSPFLMLDYFSIAEGAGFPDHPHRGMSTVTLMCDGFVQHEDFEGNQGTLGKGDLQWMTAGKGIMHAEMPLFRDPNTNEKLPSPVGLQLWIDLPAEHKFTDPYYQEMKSSEVPIARPRPADVEQPEREGSGWEIKVISGKSHGVESPVRSPKNGECWYFDIKLQPGGKVFQPIPTGWNAFFFVLGGGNIKVGDDVASLPAGTGKVYEPFHTLVLSNKASLANAQEAVEMTRSKQENGVWIAHAGKAAEYDDAALTSNPDADKEARVVLIAGQPLDQEVFQYGPFVLASRKDVQQTLIDFNMGINGFEKAKNWQSKIGRRARSNSFS